MSRQLVFVTTLFVPLALASSALADEPSAPTGAPPPDAKALAAGPKGPSDEPKIGAHADDGTTATLSAGGMLVTGNSRTMALTGTGAMESRIGRDGFGASILGNYGQGAPPGDAIVATTENIQGRIRYDRYVLDRASLFLIFTGRHDRFQGIDFRMNIDPGVKYLFLKEPTSALWGELGYDFQYDIRRDDARVVLDDDKNPKLDGAGQPILLDKTKTDHSARAFAGYRHAFNKEVTFSMGLEYLQSVIDSTRWRMNFDTLFAAKVAGGFALGFGFNARYDHEPLPAKKELDTSTNLSLIYAYSDIAEPAKPCECAKPPAPCDLPPLPPEPAPPPSPAPNPSPTPTL
jgi:putative salt-induced outer membrane protein